MKHKNKIVKIAAVVVTYNRKELLKECLEAILSQTFPVISIILIDNASDDGTRDFLKENGYLDNSKIDYIRSQENTGSSGGFYKGVKTGYKKGFNWLWLMDDDTIPAKNSLKKLVDAENHISGEARMQIGFLCSNVLWQKNQPHNMNLPLVKNLVKNIPFNKFYSANYPVLLVENSSFVSLLINSEAVKIYGYPIKEFFIWYDDTEYTQRLISQNFYGFLVLNSNVHHKTASNCGVNIALDDVKNSWKYFFYTRNRLYCYKKNKNILKFIFNFSKMVSCDIISVLKRKDYKFLFLKKIIYGYCKGFFFHPKIEK